MNPTLVLFVVCVSAVGVFAGDGKDEFMKIKDECTQQSGADKKAVDDALLKGEETTDARVRCFFACLNEKAGFVKNGEIDREKIKEGNLPEFIPADKREEIREKLAKCADITGDNLCETAYLMHRCMVKKD